MSRLVFIYSSPVSTRARVTIEHHHARAGEAWERGEWWLAGDARPWQPDAVSVLSDKLGFRPRLTPVAGRDVWHP